MTESRGTILLVDDDTTVREVLAENLSQQGYRIFQAENGEQGVALAIEVRPELIISDIVMPVMDGWDFCYTLRMMPSTRTIPFVFLTSLDKTPDRILGIKLGADDYLTKPFSPEAVVFKVKAIIRRVALRRQVLQEEEAQALDTDARFLLSDVVEFLRHTQHTGMLAVYSMGEKGVIYLRKGKPIFASMGTHSGEAAVFEMFRMPSLQIKYLEKEYPELKENLSLTWEALLSRILKPLSAPEP